ncbi:MAG: low-specificity L-threonine aldolase [Gemmatimonadetes bacterium]|nr:low-specificity L-threonine aldolase [Gemmatimonadota bacterium]
MGMDFRSDTLTKPTAAMREAMARAEVGDDVFDEDPTVHALQDEVASLFGKEAALFVASGTMANVAAVLAQTSPGTEVICEEGCHIFQYEAGSAAAFSGVQLRTIDAPRGHMRWDEIEARIRPDDIHDPPTVLVCLENTHNRAGGTIYPADVWAEIARGAHARDLRVHVDGARIWNAAVASGVSLREIAGPVDTLSVCLSKGLGAPAGSLIVGDRDFIARARRWRKRLGGGMRQVGILAAAGLHALAHHRERLQDDHDHAQILARAWADVPGASIDPGAVDTNIVIVEVAGMKASDSEIEAALGARDVRLLGMGARRLRMVTHLDVSRDDCEQAAAVIRELFA